MVLKTVNRCLWIQFILKVFQNIHCIEMKSLNAWQNCATKFQQITFHYNCEISLTVKYHLATIYCWSTKNIISLIEYQSWYCKPVSCYCRMVQVLHEVLQVFEIIWLYTTLLTYKCIHYIDKLNRITTKMKSINIPYFRA